MRTVPAPASSPSQPPRADAAWRAADLRADPHRHSEKADKVRRMFASIAGSYDLNNRLHSFGRDVAWRRAAVRAARLQPDDAVLDVACGTGDLAIAFARAGAGQVVGVDFTPEMLEVARERTRAAQGPEAAIDWRRGDAMALDIPEASFDVVSIAFGIRNVVEPARALAEFRRVLRPAGRLVVLEFDRPRSPVIAALNDFYTRRVMPWTATLVSADRSGAYHYLPRSIETFLDRDAMASAIRSAGFDGLTQTPLTFGVCVCHAARVPA